MLILSEIIITIGDTATCCHQRGSVDDYDLTSFKLEIS